MWEWTDCPSEPSQNWEFKKNGLEFGGDFLQVFSSCPVLNFVGPGGFGGERELRLVPGN